jgi:hypothetical protein
MSSEKKITSTKLRAFWPKVYRPNLKKYPVVTDKFGSAERVMKAEKQWIWDSINYNDKCEVLSLDLCNKATEDRHEFILVTLVNIF